MLDDVGLHRLPLQSKANAVKQATEPARIESEVAARRVATPACQSASIAFMSRVNQLQGGDGPCGRQAGSRVWFDGLR